MRCDSYCAIAALLFCVVGSTCVVRCCSVIECANGVLLRHRRVGALLSALSYDWQVKLSCIYNYYDKRCVYTPTAFHLLLVLRTLLSQVARETKVREYLGGRSSMARRILLRGALRRSSSGADFAAGLMREAESLKACNRVLPDVISRSGSDRLTRLST